MVIEAELKGKESRFIALDSLRGFAAVSVFLFHCTLGYPSAESSIFRFGVTGVDLFFMISGFVIILTLQRSNSGISFVVNRFAKLYPVYWVIVTFTALLTLIKLNGEGILNLLTVYIGNLTMFQRYLGIPNLDEQYWTLEIEIIFYALMLLIFLCGRLRSIEKIGLIILFFCILYDLLLEDIYPISKYFALINHFPLFYSGIIFFKIKNEGGNAFRYLALVICFAGACMLFNNGGRSMYYLSFREYLPVLLVYFCVFALALNDRMKFLTIKPFLFMGRISYSFYLIHQYLSSQIIIPMVQKYISQSFYLAVCIAFIVSACLSVAVTLWIEEPSVRFGKAFLKRN